MPCTSSRPAWQLISALVASGCTASGSPARLEVAPAERPIHECNRAARVQEQGSGHETEEEEENPFATPSRPKYKYSREPTAHCPPAETRSGLNSPGATGGSLLVEQVHEWNGSILHVCLHAEDAALGRLLTPSDITRV